MSLNRNGFQGYVNVDIPPGLLGARASMNPRAFALGGEGCFRQEPNETCRVGRFAWGVPSSGLAYGVQTAGGILGFVANESDALITTFLAQDTLIYKAGQNVNIYTHGDFWAVVAGAVNVGDTIYALNADGSPTTSSASATDTGYKAATASPADTTALACTIAAGTGVLTAGTVTGSIQPGMNVTGTGVPAGVYIVRQLTGTAGAAGTYQTNYNGPAVGSATYTFSQGRLVKISRSY